MKRLLLSAGLTISFAAVVTAQGVCSRLLERLAFIYVVASVRAGKWLIPAFHSSLDLGFPDRHDDPQNFNLQDWADNLAALIAILNTIHN